MFYSGFRLFSSIWGLITFGLAVWATWWTYTDAKSNGMLAWLWAGVTFLIFPLGFIVYLIARSFSKSKTVS